MEESQYLSIEYPLLSEGPPNRVFEVEDLPKLTGSTAIDRKHAPSFRAIEQANHSISSNSSINSIELCNNELLNSTFIKYLCRGKGPGKLLR